MCRNIASHPRGGFLRINYLLICVYSAHTFACKSFFLCTHISLLSSVIFQISMKVPSTKIELGAFLFDPAPFTQFRDLGVSPAPRGASRASG